ncbi:hypothetical protein HHI36_010699, partial [Cryptolaemus montrouzieri]
KSVHDSKEQHNQHSYIQSKPKNVRREYTEIQNNVQLINLLHACELLKSRLYYKMPSIITAILPPAQTV